MCYTNINNDNNTKGGLMSIDYDSWKLDNNETDGFTCDSCDEEFGEHETRCIEVGGKLLCELCAELVILEEEE